MPRECSTPPNTHAGCHAGRCAREVWDGDGDPSERGVKHSVWSFEMAALGDRHKISLAIRSQHKPSAALVKLLGHHPLLGTWSIRSWLVSSVRWWSPGYPCRRTRQVSPEPPARDSHGVRVLHGRHGQLCMSRRTSASAGADAAAAAVRCCEPAHWELVGFAAAARPQPVSNSVTHRIGY